MSDTSDLKKQRDELIQDFRNVQEKVKTYVDNLKLKGSEELLNGSVEKAQGLISAIIPIETAVKKLKKDQEDLLNVLEKQEDGEDADETESPKKEEDNTSSEKDMVVEDTSAQDSEPATESGEGEPEEAVEEETPQEAFRLPILKALIYLGGSGKIKDVTNFIEKDMKNKFRVKDNEILNGDGTKEWIKKVNKEQFEMTEEGLLNSDSEEGYWEIAQAGIDYLAKNKKSS